MDYTIERDENEKIINVFINGKPVKRSYMRGIRKAQETLYWKEIKTPHTFRNPFSGKSIQLNPLESTIYNWCMSWYSRFSFKQETGTPLQTFDDMKYFLLGINTEAYYTLID